MSSDRRPVPSALPNNRAQGCRSRNGGVPWPQGELKDKTPLMPGSCHKEKEVPVPT
ncbi:UNVERIFIED_CONTAM: hypothetical protein Slati_1674600 [Sesamum latifolium]|uniref:Uncharacterized protein n=1 Tax=Sesamum latifolium TaxID=2727402 RepID=A0AAW2WUA7_9LAMI